MNLTVDKQQWQIIGGGETSLLGARLSGDFLPPLQKAEGQPSTVEWVPLETTLKIMQMPKVVNSFHSDQRIKSYCEEWFPKLARRAIGVTPAERTEALRKARELISAESKDLKWSTKMVAKKPKTAPYLKRVLAESRSKRTSEKKAIHEAKLTNTGNTSIA